MKTKVKSITVILITILSFNCIENSNIIGSQDVAELSSAEFTITATSYTSSKLTVSGTVANTGNSVYYPRWYIEGEFYSDDNYSIKLGGSSTSINFSLAPGESTFWELDFSSNSIVESDYPNFAVRNLRAYLNN
jgi:hypothetical protein